MKEWKEKFEKLDALWIHGGVPSHPHALLTSGKHSSGFFNATKISENPRILSDACYNLFQQCGTYLHQVDRVVGSAYGAITIAHEIAKIAGCKTAFTEAVLAKEKQMVLKRFDIKSGQIVQMVEDVMTTGGTTLLSIKELEKKGIIIADKILVLVNRSGMTKLDGREIIALINHEMPIWTAEECPLCKNESEAIRPKDNWAKLTAK